MSNALRTVLWWGRFDPDYSRNRILREAYVALGWKISEFLPLLSPLADLEATMRRLPHVDLVHVPCFRQRDIAAASRYAHRRGLPLLIDPLISAYDKQVFERGKFAPDHVGAKRLLRQEQKLFQLADIVLADTAEHARFFASTLNVPAERLHVVYVGAEESLFTPGEPRAPNQPPEVLFFGSFIGLQGPMVIVDAARRYHGPPVRWTLLGNGSLRAECEQHARGLGNILFEDWVPYRQLADRIRRADILLGVFGESAKAGRVIPNKVFQALACGKPLVTRSAPAYPQALRDAGNAGIRWVPAADAAALANAVAALAAHPERLGSLGAEARRSYERNFSAQAITTQLRSALSELR